jgi:hypothetical protein
MSEYAMTLNKVNIPKVFINVMKTNILHNFRARKREKKARLRSRFFQISDLRTPYVRTVRI